MFKTILNIILDRCLHCSGELNVWSEKKAVCTSCGVTE